MGRKGGRGQRLTFKLHVHKIMLPPSIKYFTFKKYENNERKILA